MDRKHVIAGAPEVRVPIRVRGMTQEERYFDEQASTSRVTGEFIVIRLQNQVDLDSELHITNMRNQVGGIYRVAWVNTKPGEPLYPVGLELLDPEGEIWEEGSIGESQDTGDLYPVTLECRRCKGHVSMPVLEAETEALCEGFAMSRHCETCKATTGWIYTAAQSPVPVAPTPSTGATAAPSAAAGEARPGVVPGKPGVIENRLKGRAPIKMTIKVIRNKYGRKFENICETINISRTGAYFSTEQNYELGEEIQVILPYQPDGVAIPVPGRVVRQDTRPGTYQKFVAIHLTSEKPTAY